MSKATLGQVNEDPKFIHACHCEAKGRAEATSVNPVSREAIKTNLPQYNHLKVASPGDADLILGFGFLILDQVV
jgi:hypothetical protein